MAKCLRCGAGNEWIEGRVKVEPKETAPDQVAARFLKWMDTPKGKKALAKAKKEADELKECFKQRPFTAEELNRRYRQPSSANTKDGNEGR